MICLITHSILSSHGKSSQKLEYNLQAREDKTQIDYKLLIAPNRNNLDTERLTRLN